MINKKIKIVSMGRFLPERKVCNGELETRLGLKKGWINKRNGVRERYHVTNETASFMGAKAAMIALKRANLTLNNVGLIICASGTQQQAVPCTAALIQKELGAEAFGIPCFDINATCLSFVTALDTIAPLVAGKQYSTALIISSDVPSVGLDADDPITSTLFGDGAAAAVITASPENSSSRILASIMETHSLGTHYCEMRVGSNKHPLKEDTKRSDYLFQMDGKKLFKLSAQKIDPLFHQLLDHAQLTLEDISLIIPHQASRTALDLIRKRLKISPEKMVDILSDYGNTVAASIPMALSAAIEQNRVKRGDKVMLFGTSAGVSIGGLIIEY